MIPLKRIISLVLVFCLATTFVACHTTTDSNTYNQPFLVGYSKINITPEYSVPLRGYGNPEQRMSTDVYDDIYATCVAITGTNGETVIVFGIDLSVAFSNCFPDYRKAVAKACKVPVENVHMSCSHMHSGCDMSLTSNPAVNNYIQDMETWLIAAGKQAMEDRTPSTIQYASTYTENLNFVRRYYRADGTPTGDNYGKFSDAPIAEHESEVDNQLQLIKFLRENSTDIIMANFQMHPHRNGSASDTNITADIIGVFRNELENQLGVNVVYFTGSSGNVNPTSRIVEENITADYLEQGQALAKYAIDMEGAYTNIPVGSVHTLTQTYTGPTDHSQDYKLEAAEYLKAALDRGESFSSYKDFAMEHGFNSKFTPDNIIAKANAPATHTTDVFAFSISTLGFAAVPFEMFDTNGMFIKDNSPFTATFVLTCANLHNSYLPSALGFQNGGYEVEASIFAEGTGEIIADLYVEMLNTLKSK